MNYTNKQITVFFSWQADSPQKTNRYFIEECLKIAAKEVTKEIPIIIHIDRDTKNVGGMPAIADTILKKIRNSDIFLWDATIIYEQPKFSPNPNVLIELGYAFALLGEGRIIGVINESNGLKADKLPFDLIHRRWPINYNLTIDDLIKPNLKNEQKKFLIKKLKKALLDALNGPKKGIIQSDIDFIIANKLWEIINSDWIFNWLYFKKNNLPYEQKEYLKTLDNYNYFAQKPENQFVNKNLNLVHSLLLKSIVNYIITSNREMVDNGNHLFVISTKRNNSVKNYDQEYDAQVEKLSNALIKVENSWNIYVQELRLNYPEITHK